MASKQKKHEKGKKNDRDISRPQENPQSKNTQKPRKNSAEKRGVIKTIALYLMVFMICLFGFTAAYVLGSDAWGMLDISKIKNAQQSMILYDFNGEQVAFAHGTENRIWVSIDEIPQQIRNVFVAAEDVRFYSHPGVDIRRIFGALWEDIKAGREARSGRINHHAAADQKQPFKHGKKSEPKDRRSNSIHPAGTRMFQG